MNNQDKIHIKVWITKTNEFRASVKRPDSPLFEVNIGGYSWDNGKVTIEEKAIIIKKVNDLAGFILETAKIIVSNEQ